MSRKPILLAAMLLVSLCIVCPARAQSDSPRSENPTVLDKAVSGLDSLGHAIFGGFMPKKKSQQEQVDASFYENGGYIDQALSRPSTGRAGSTMQNGTATPRYQRDSYSADTGDARGVYLRRPEQADGKSQISGSEASAARVFPGPSSTIVESASGDTRPLYQRLMSARQSAFSSSVQSPSAERHADATSPKPEATTSPVKKETLDTILGASQEPELDPGSDEAAAAMTIRQPLGIRRGSSKSRVPGQPTLAQPKPASDRPAEPTLAPAAAARPRPVAAGADRVLLTQRSPALSVRALGPKQIAVGKESAFEVFVQNAGEVAAEGVVVSIELPNYAEVQNTEAGSGTAHPPVLARGVHTVEWDLGQLKAKDQERLVLRIVPRESRPIDLAMRVTYAPPASQAVIEVQEPKLAMRLHGPREVLYGKQEVFKLELVNAGNGDADNVVISLAPIGSAGGAPDTHKLGSLPAGKRKIIELELTPRQDGQVVVQVGIAADAGVHAELAEKILVRRPAIQLAVEGPKVKYVGTAAAYRIHATNPGTAPAREIRISVALPHGAKYLASNKSGQLAKDGSKVTWSLSSLAPGAEEILTVECQLADPGTKQLAVTSSAADELSAATAMTTQVDAIADLVLSVSDPVGPVGVGEDAWYELRVQNRGTESAAGVEVVTYFSNGVEPLVAEGGPNRIEPGQVAFDPIASIPPGKTMTLKVKARAQAAGNHVFRAEVFCRPLGSHLVSEETTLFYGSASDATRLAKQSPKDVAPPESREVLRTAERPLPPASVPRYGTPTLAPLRK